MKRFLVLFLCVSAHLAYSATPQVTAIRNLYYQSASSKESALQLSKLLLFIDSTSTPILICYKGAAEMMEAKYALNPFSKLKRFIKGKELIEAAIKRDPDDLEMRFLRLSIQTNLPSFLRYNDCIELDKEILSNKIDKITDHVLKKDVIKYLALQETLLIKNKVNAK